MLVHPHYMLQQILIISMFAYFVNGLNGLKFNNVFFIRKFFIDKLSFYIPTFSIITIIQKLCLKNCYKPFLYPYLRQNKISILQYNSAQLLLKCNSMHPLVKICRYFLILFVSHDWAQCRLSINLKHSLRTKNVHEHYISYVLLLKRKNHLINIII